MVQKSSQVIFMDGKEIALKKLFDGKNGGVFGYLAIGYANTDNGFIDPKRGSSNEQNTSNGFNEVTESQGYHRIPLELYATDPVDKDKDTGKVLVKFTATLDTENIQQSQPINQIAVVDNATIGADTKIYSASTFQTFVKTGESSITFIIGFRF